MSTLAVTPGSAGAWRLALRLRTLFAAIVPVLVGSAVAHAAGGFRPGPAAAALGGALALQIAANLANDAADFRRGADGPGRLGPTRAAAAGLLSARSLELGAMTALARALAAGVYLASVAGPWVVALGALSMVAAVAYTAGPWPLAYHGLGEAFVMVFFGLAAVGGTAFVQLGTVPIAAWPAAIAVGALATALLSVNNLRDRTTDAAAGKRTLAVRFGERFARYEIIGCLIVAYAMPVVLGVLLPLVTLPLAFLLARRALREDGAALNGVLAETARLLALFGLLLAAGIAAGAP